MSIRRALPLVVLVALSGCDFESEITPIAWPTVAPQRFEETSSAPTVPLQTPFARPTAPPAPTPYPQMYVTEDGLRLRDAPGLGSNVLEYLNRHTIVRLIGDPIYVEGDNWTWQEVELADGRRGFVALEFITAEIPPLTWQDVAPLSGDGLGRSGFYYGEQLDDGLHPGIDISADDGTVRANSSGRVYMYQTWQDEQGWHVIRYDPSDPVSNEDLSGFGNYIVYETEVAGETYYQVYGHLDSFQGGLNQGQEVPAGTVLASMGATGNTTGPHVHWEVRRESGVRTSGDGTHILDVYYPQDESEMDQFFVDPDEFAEQLD